MKAKVQDRRALQEGGFNLSRKIVVADVTNNTGWEHGSCVAK
jgi:hypothetical protein